MGGSGGARWTGPSRNIAMRNRVIRCGGIAVLKRNITVRNGMMWVVMLAIRAVILQCGMG